MRRVFLFLAFAALGLPLSLEAKPAEQLFPQERIPTRDTKSSFDIPQDNDEWSVTAGIIRLRPKSEDRFRVRDNQKRGPSHALGIRLTKEF